MAEPQGKELYEHGMQPHGLDLGELREKGICGELLEKNGAFSASVHSWKSLWK